MQYCGNNVTKHIFFLKHPDLIYSELNTQLQTKSPIPPPEQPTDVQYSILIYDAEKRSTDDIHPVDKTSVRRGEQYLLRDAISGSCSIRPLRIVIISVCT